MSEKVYSSIIQIDNCLVSGDVITEYFACDYEVCKGCCCIIGDSGAPLNEDETEEFERNYDSYKDELTQEARDIISEKGFFDVDIEGDIVTPLCKNEACVYSKILKDNSCFCAVERKFFEGKSKFRKPISCWLYPIRITKLSNGMDALNLHRWEICKPAFEKGKREGIRVYQFLREPLIHLYGEDFYSALEEADKMLNA